MTQQFGDHTSPESQRSTPEVARDEAADVAKTAANKGGEVAGTVGEQASRVAQETKQQARNLLHESREQLSGQARQGQQKAAEGLRTLATQLQQMSEKTEDGGVASEVARQVADRTHSAASWLENRQPGDLLDEVRRFARRKPGVFLLGAALAGVAVGRLTRGAIAAQSDDTGGGQDARTERLSTPSAAGLPRHAADAPYGTPTTPGYSMPPEPSGYPAAPQTPGYPAAPQAPGYPTAAAPPVPQPWEQQSGPVNR